MRISGKRHGVKDWTGKRVNWLTVLSYVDVRGGNSRWLCRCDCGEERIVAAPSLKSGLAKSCGCKKSALVAASRTTHGGAPRNAHDAAYHCWQQMQSRCLNQKNNRFKNYGGRGVTVCDRWRFGDGVKRGFACFLEDMGRRPSKGHSIDRINVYGNYEPSNCRWATHKEQCRNKTTNRYYQWRGEKLALVSICEMEGAEYGRTLGRLHQGWSINDAVNMPKYGRYGEAA